MKKALELPAQYKFYSLKDTGITDLIRANTDLLSVRDQARHHSLQMTDLYTRLNPERPTRLSAIMSRIFKKKGRPGGRPTQDILQVSLKNNYEMRIDDNFPPMSFRA